jgi:hypothetical protein
MKVLSVTGRKAQAPKVPEFDVVAEAVWSVLVDWLTRHWKMVWELLP